MLELYQLNVQQLIGSVSGTTTDSETGVTLQIGPILGIQSHLSADRVFTSAEEYTRFLADLKRRSWVIGEEASDIKKAHETIDKFEAYTLRLWAKFDQPAMRRCVIKHGDAVPHNIHMTPEGGASRHCRLVTNSGSNCRSIIRR